MEGGEEADVSREFDPVNLTVQNIWKKHNQNYAETATLHDMPEHHLIVFLL